MITRETNTDFARRLGLANPIERLLKAIARREWMDPSLCTSIRPGQLQLQWRELVRSQLIEAKDALGTSAGPAPQSSCRLLHVHDILPEVFQCTECGLMYGTSAALKRHMFREHMTEEEQLQTAGVKHRMIATDNMIHSASGMPQCRHCGHKFTTWHAFCYHVNTQGCPTLRELAAGQSEKADITNMSEALVENPSILSLAVQCTWRQLAEHPQTRRNHHHCPECHQWMATPQYVKRQGQGGQKHTQSTIQQLLASKELRPAAGEPSMEGTGKLPMEGGRDDGHGPGTASCHRQYVNSPRPSPRHPACDSQARLGFRSVCPHGRSRQFSEEYLPASPAMARPESQLAGQAQTSHEDHFVPTCDQVYGRKVREDGGHSVLEINGSGDGLDEHGRADGERAKMGLGGPQACQGRHGGPTQDTGGPRGPTGDPGGVRGALGRGQVPCDEKACSRVFQSDHHDDAGDRASHGTCPTGLEASEPDGALRSLGSSGGIPAQRRHAAERPRTEAGCYHKLLMSRLGNRGNHCYGNSVLRGLVAAAMAMNGLQHLFDGGMLKFVERLLSNEGIVHLWAQPCWAALVRTWELPERQHDGAEFILYLLRQLPYTAGKVMTAWQARQQQDDHYVTTDQGCSAPLLLQPPAWACQSDDHSLSVQELIDGWRDQDALHALVMPPKILTLQIGRFGFDHDGARTMKHRFKLVPDLYVGVPVFDPHMNVHHDRYRLCSTIVHVGVSPDSGHYFNTLHDADGRVMLADDNITARFVEESTCVQHYGDIYILFYKSEPL